ncbi:hypothetical protein [Croceimicrobium hydrocarbonivorans]|uniref:Uncharacterized protein n=1 Tax=Croceimicrobium hydrocarbonivorans TaxID=2761580 RepID=A0A7H0VDX0_9FLAO|nr:hypothetical protein [Croceimicrobium hydrocarbonivorans]QNR23918.1 hypothetical protein H4K34_16300 [Croceimicrobium hydrocarbonivorans]
MNPKNYKIPTILAVLYWIPATLYLFSDAGTGSNSFLVPGCILGFAFGYGGSLLLALLGQLINLIVLILIGSLLYEPIRRMRANEK